MESILPQKLIDEVSRYAERDKLFELRLRKGRKISANIAGKYIEIDTVCNPEWIQETLLKAGKFSLYAVNEQIKAGFIGVSGGIRIGLCGQAVYDGENIKTLKSITSLNVRFPHEIKGCGGKVLRHCFDGKMLSTLVISPPGAGKTTLIRDICRSISDGANVLIIDERGEISGEADGGFSFDIGSSDVLLYCKKQFGFINGIRSMRPEVIVCDELKGLCDIQSVEEALYCGVSVVATLHAQDISDLRYKRGFERLIESKAFKRYIILTDTPAVGTLKNVYDENMEVIV